MKSLFPLLWLVFTGHTAAEPQEKADFGLTCVVLVRHERPSESRSCCVLLKDDDATKSCYLSALNEAPSVHSSHTDTAGHWRPRAATTYCIPQVFYVSLIFCSQLISFDSVEILTLCLEMWSFVLYNIIQFQSLFRENVFTFSNFRFNSESLTERLVRVILTKH